MTLANQGATSVGASSSNPSGTVTRPAMAEPAPIASRLPDMATFEMQQRLPKLDDDDDVGVEKEFTVTRDGDRDLKFRGTLLASAAPECRGQERWREYRVYKTVGGKYVLSRVGRSVLHNERDKFEAFMWNSDQPGTEYGDLLSGPREKVLSDVLVDFFKLDQLAKQLYAKLNIDTTTRID
jgi:hypothetical protein